MGWVEAAQKILTRESPEVACEWNSYFMRRGFRSSACFPFRELLCTILPSVSKGDSILDAGCGVGIDLLQLANEGYTNLQGIDANVEHVSAARAVMTSLGLDIPVSVGDVNALAGEYQVIMALDFMYNTSVPTVPDMLARVESHLLSGGYYAFDLFEFEREMKTSRRYYTVSEVHSAVVRSGRFSVVLTVTREFGGAKMNFYVVRRNT